MDKSPPNSTNLVESHKPEIDRLHRMVRNMHSMTLIRYYYKQLSELEVELTIEFMMNVEALTTALVVTYGRMFSETQGVTKFTPSILPKEFTKTHEQIMVLRHERYAHHGNHDSVKTGLDFENNGSEIIISPQLQIGMWLGAPPEWEALLIWLDGHIHDQIKVQIEHLNRVSGTSWNMKSGPTPSWASNDE